MSEGLKLKIRKDLSRWSRKLLLCVGLEDIAKSLVGEEKFQNLYPWKDQEKIPVDFDPSSEPDIPEDNASAASGDLSHVDPSETPEEEVGVEEKTEPSLENFLHLLPYWCFINRAFGGVPGGGGGGLGNTPEDIVVGRGEGGEDLTSAANDDALDVNQRLNSFLLLETLRQQYAQVVPTGLQNSFHVQNSPFLSPDIYEANKIPKFHHSYLNADAKYHEALHTGLRGLSSTDQEEDRDDEPLDLTQKNKGAEKFSENRKYGSREVNTTTIETKPNKVSPRPAQPRSGKGYTSTELELALRDIQSGKLGTRRAAVIYGIPRSTLRNKVYKLGKDRNRPYFRQKNTATNFTEDQKDSTSSSLLNIDTRITDQISTGARVLREGGGGETGIEFQNANIGLPHTSLSSSSSLSISNSHSQGVHASCSGGAGAGADSEEDDELGRIRSEEEISHEKKMLKEWLRTKLSRQAFEQHLNSPILNERFNSSSDVSQNPAIIEPQSDNSSDNSDEVSRQDLRKEVILKIPSLINNKSSLSRMISRKKLKRRSPRGEEEEDEEASTRSDNLPSYPIPLLNMLGLESASSTTNRLTGGGEGNNDMSSRNWKNPRLSNNNNNNNNNENESLDDIDKQDKYNSSWGDYDKESASTSNSNNNNNSADGKKSRPKRGKYRNYDRDALLKAVRAVQDGQMSVHRAGSFYGVPHSTLEYKVKERHLLRRPKRKETDSPKLSKSSPETSMSGSDPQRNSGTPGAETTTNSLPLTPDLRESLSRYMNISNTSSSFKNSDEPHGENRLDQLSNHNSSSLGLGRGISPFLNLNLFNLDDLMIRQNLGTVGNSNSLDLTKK